MPGGGTRRDITVNKGASFSGPIAHGPVRARLSARAEGWRWSSAAAHISRKDDRLVTVKPMLRLVKKKWVNFLALN
jgi:hypothetical protein